LPPVAVKSNQSERTMDEREVYKAGQRMLMHEVEYWQGVADDSRGLARALDDSYWWVHATCVTLLAWAVVISGLYFWGC